MWIEENIKVAKKDRMRQNEAVTYPVFILNFDNLFFVNIVH